MHMERIPPFDYIKGEAFTEILKEVSGCKTLLDMSELFGIPKATFSAWNTHERTSHELMVRLHLAKGVPIEKMALGIDRPLTGLVSEPIARYLPTKNQEPSVNPQHQTAILKSFCLTNGQLIETGEIPYAKRIFNSWNLNEGRTIEIETNDGRFIVDQEAINAVSGKYLIDIDGNLSINQIQRLPGKKLAIVFGESTIEVSEHDIKVLGRVAVTLKKD
ncbi:helix-turn-helix domain-containing protein [Vibrio vulnificus]|nr:helix-turn-helix domain-containing protein [Vibrio vulnificus]POC08277.1 chromosome partitioning protein ParA [Vibrio vulnificus]POC78269.1 chromosome partitioning protein ParA [Vibrio vulnificus]